MRIAVVGGGIAGLTAAYRLREHEVVVFEGADRIGGKLRSETVGDATLDVGAESILARRPEAVGLCAELGLDAVHPTTSQAAIWSGGQVWPIPRGVLDAREIDGPDVSVADYVLAHADRETLDQVVDPLLGGVYAGDPAYLSYAATRSSLAGLGAVEPAAGPAFAGLDGGIGQLPEVLAQKSGAEVRIGVRVIGIESGWRLETTAGPEQFDAVVVATPAPATARLLAEVAPRSAFELADVEVASVAIATCVFDAEIELPGSGFLVPPAEGRAIKGATFSSNKWQWLAAPGRTVLRASVGRAGESELLHCSDDDVLAQVLADLVDAVGALPTPVATHLQRWGGGLPQYRVGHLDKLAAIDAEIASVPGLELCGASYRGVGIAAVVADATGAAERILS